MTDALTSAPLVAQARELFFEEGRDPEPWISPSIARSWRRCRAETGALADVVPMALSRLRERREQALRLLDCAQPELDGLAEHALGHGCVVVLSDSRGLILEEIGSPDFLPKAQRVALAPGVEWSEGNRGTNAIGTALVERQALMVLGAEHYLPQNGGLGCAAALIFSGRGEVTGVLDISGDAVHVNSHALALVSMAAQQVEHRMMLREAAGHLLRFHHRPSLLGTPREGLVIMDEAHIVAANRVALALLGEQWESLLGQPVERLFGLPWTKLGKDSGLLTLPQGQQVAALVERSHLDLGKRWGAGKWPTSARVTPPAADDVLSLADQALRIMNEGVPVLLTGETGTGKEVFARRLHGASRRAKGPFVAVNCAALPDTLIEAELFGYEEGAFTGARRRGVPGRIREAHGGVLFLDEIGDMPLALQTRLLRVLEERVVTPLGGGSGVAVDFDLICATHCDLQALAAAGRFRSDLMYRVNGFTVNLPALRDRKDRQALITRLFEETSHAKQLRMDACALEHLQAYRWPGNVRELCSVLRTVVALADAGDTITLEQLPAQIRAVEAAANQEATQRWIESGTATALAEMTRHAIDRTLAECSGNVAQTARRLGVHRSTVYRHLPQKRSA